MIIAALVSYDKEEFSIRAWREICRATMQAVAEHWHAELLPKHFRPSAPSEYGYAPRDAYYEKQKAARGISDALTFHGELHREVQSMVTFRAFPTRATATMTGPPYLDPDRRGRRANAPNLKKEIAAISSADADILQRVAQEAMDREVLRHNLSSKNLQFAYGQTDPFSEFGV